MLLYHMLILMMPLLSASCGPRYAPQCDCRALDSSGRCFISTAAPEGFKCKCSSRNAPCRYCGRICDGDVIPCRNDEACPGGRYSYCACVQGGGQCDGYTPLPATVQNCPKVNKLDMTSPPRKYPQPFCNCDYYDGGCIIVDAAPEGFKCSCSNFARWTCQGLAIGCPEDQYCPANDHTYCACLRGGGNCEGYPERDRNQVCDLGSVCDCDRSTDWTKGRYTVSNVIFDTNNLVKSQPKPVEIGHVIDLPNASNETQSQRMIVSNTMTSESSFVRSHGIAVDMGLKFTTILPIESLLPSTTQTFTYGETITTSNQTSHWYPCASPPKTRTICKIFLMSSEMTMPYTMILNHKYLPNCECNSYGDWKSTTSYHSTMFSETIGPCNRIVSGECVP